ncbi:MAG: hypothetical protein ACP5LP_00600 [Candidatus Micrarchaeia archaeon]
MAKTNKNNKNVKSQVKAKAPASSHSTQIAHSHYHKYYIALAITVIVAFLIAYFTLSLLHLASSYSLISNDYSHAVSAMSNPLILNPPIIFYTNTTHNVSALQIGVPANQTFCPENSTIVERVGKMLYIPYYTNLSIRENFTYAEVLNTSQNLSIIGAYVSKPFVLKSYKIVSLTSEKCAGYPNALKEVVFNLQGPSYNYTGRLIIIAYVTNQ